VSGRLGAGEELVYLLEPRRWQRGNSLRVVDWSHDSRRLLAEVSIWQYQADVIDQALLLYDTLHGTFDTPDVVSILTKRLGKSCETGFLAKGFSPNGDIVIEMTPLPGGGTGSDPGCPARKELWLLHWDRDTLEPLAEGTGVRAYGKWLPPERGGEK